MTFGQMKFSVITVTKDAARHIAACIDSVKTQTFDGVEHLIIDGVSSDDTVAIARSLLRAGDQLISEPDHGIYDAMNRGVALAKGDYVLILGADDFLVDRNVLADVAAFIAAEGAPDLIYGDLEVREVRGGRSVFRAPEPDKALELMICGCLPHQATFARRDLFAGKDGLFDTRYRVQADYDWFLRALAAPGLQIRHMRRVISSFAMGGASSQLQVGQQETYGIQNAFPLYRQPEWVEKRLLEFQRQTLALRLQMLDVSSGSERLFAARVKRGVRRMVTRLSNLLAAKP